MADSGLSVPAIEQRPSLYGLDWLWEAWGALTTCRAIGMGVGPIPWIYINDYANAEQLSNDERYLLHVVIRKMDTVYLDFINEKKSDGNK